MAERGRDKTARHDLQGDVIFEGLLLLLAFQHCPLPPADSPLRTRLEAVLAPSSSLSIGLLPAHDHSSLDHQGFVRRAFIVAEPRIDTPASLRADARGVHITYREPTTDPIRVLPY